MKLTLIQPSVGKIANKPYIKSWTMEPLALATLAGLTPKEFEVELIDERIDELPEVYDTDVVGITIDTKGIFSIFLPNYTFFILKTFSSSFARFSTRFKSLVIITIFPEL